MSDCKLVPESIVDELAQFIRQVDGNNKMGAGSLAEKICERFRVAAPTVQGEPVGFCEDTALSLAERTFSSEVDEHLAEDVIQYARRLYDLYTATQPECGCCGQTIKCDDDCDAVVIGGNLPIPDVDVLGE